MDVPLEPPAQVPTTRPRAHDEEDVSGYLLDVLVEANRRLQDANERLTDQLVRQAEELGGLRERLAAAEAVSGVRPDEGPLTPASDAPRSDERSALWGTLAAHVQVVQATPQRTPEPPTRRSLIRRLLRC